MFFKRQLRKHVGVKVFDIILLISIIFSIGKWSGFFALHRVLSKHGRLSPLSELSLSGALSDAIICSIVLVISAYYALDFSSIVKKGFFEEEKLKKEIDERILNAKVALKEIRSSIKKGVNESKHFDDYARQLIMLKSDTVISKCSSRLVMAEKLREEAESIPIDKVKSKLFNIREFLFKGVSFGIDQLGEILARIQAVNSRVHLNDADIRQLADELDNELLIAEKVDQTMKKWTSGEIMEKLEG